MFNYIHDSLIIISSFILLFYLKLWRLTVVFRYFTKPCANSTAVLYQTTIACLITYGSTMYIWRFLCVNILTDWWLCCGLSTNPYITVILFNDMNCWFTTSNWCGKKRFLMLGRTSVHLKICACSMQWIVSHVFSPVIDLSHICRYKLNVFLLRIVDEKK